MNMKPAKKRRSPPASPDLPRVLLTLRASRRLTQADLERLSGVPASSISEYEAGKTTPGLATLTRLLRGMGLGLPALETTEDYLRALDMGGRSVLPERPEPPSEAERERAADLFERLRSHGPLIQDALLGEATEFRSWALAERFCMESTRSASQDADQALAFARRAEVIATQPVLPEPYSSKLRAYVAAHLGSAHRVKGDLLRASATFAEADRHLVLGREAPAFLKEEERIDALRASFLIAAGRLVEAREVLRRLLETTGDPAMRAAHLVNLARAFEEDGDYESATETLREAAPAVEAARDERLSLCLKHNLLWLQTSLGNFEGATLLLPEVTALARRLGNDLDWVRLQWAKGRIAAGVGRDEEGIELLSRVRGEFAARSVFYDMALVTLELAGLHARAGRKVQVKDLSRHLAPIFRAQGLPAHALAALGLFRQAAEKEAVTASLAARLVAYFERARFRPELRFEA